jgi:outer membrane lipoprotein SlyB
MRRTLRRFIPFLGISVLVSSGCETFTERGALAGAGLGAAAGALVGSQNADAGKGALIGGALGTVAGALTGAAIDGAENRATARAVAAQQAGGSPLSVADVVGMAQAGVSDETILASVRSSPSTFQLSAADVVHLHTCGVSDRVIQAMMDKRPAAVVRPVYVREPAPVYIVEPVPPPVGIHFGYYRPWRRHCW